MSNDTTIPFLVRPFLNKKCYDTFVDGDLFHGECLQLLSSKIISYVIIAVTSLFVKMPQVIKIYRAKSGRGINLYSQAMMISVGIMGITYNMARDFPISTWAEIFVLSLQQVAIVFLILWYSGKQQMAALCLVLYGITLGIMSTSWIPMSLHIMLQVTNIPISTSSKLIQIWTNWTNHSTGQLSAMTVMMQGLRCVGRCYSSIVETGDMFRICLYAEASFLNAVIFSQIIYYGYKGVAKKKI